MKKRIQAPPGIEPATGVAMACAPRVPLLRAALVQAVALALTAPLLVLFPDATARLDPLFLALIQGCVAALLGNRAGMERWWLPMHALFAPGLVWALGLGLPPIYPLLVFIGLVSVYWSVLRTRVPLYLSSRAAAKAVAHLLPRERSFTFVDIGSGFGGMLDFLARARPAGRYYGIEAAPLPFFFSRLRMALGLRSRQVNWGDYHDLDLGRFDVVYAYLSPAAMTALWAKASREMRAGSLLISNSFAVPGVAPADVVPVGEQGHASLLLWRM